MRQNETNMIHVLYLSYDGLTDPLGQSQVLPYIIGLCKEGYHFHIISFEKSKFFESGKGEIEAKIADLNISWYPQNYHKRPPIISTLFDLREMYQLSKKLVKRHQISLVHCRSYPPGLIGLKLKKEFDIKFLFDIRGFWANERVDGGLWNLANPLFKLIYNYFKRREISMMTGADHIISLTHAGKEEIVSGRLFNGAHQGISAHKITVIPCAVDLTIFDPSKIEDQEKNSLRDKLGLNNLKEICIYLGSLGTWYLLDEMLLYFKAFQEKEPTSKFLFVTKDDPEVIYFASDRLSIDRASIVITSARRDEVPLHLSIGTRGVFFIKPAYSKKASSAVKMGEMLAMGLDIVTNKGVGDADFIPHNTSAIQIEGTLQIIEIISPVSGDALEAYKLDIALLSYSSCYATLSVE